MPCAAQSTTRAHTVRGGEHRIDFINFPCGLITLAMCPGYHLKSGTLPLLEEATAWFKRRHDIELNPATEALALIGSQEGLAHLLLAVCDHGDTILTTNPAYPSYFGAIKLAGNRLVASNPSLFHNDY